MRVISLVPSWTETLIEAGVDVVGRTRFCIHPKNRVKNIAIVGGTKNIDIEKIVSLKSDYILLDQEENTLEIIEQLNLRQLKWKATHVVDIETCAKEILSLAHLFQNNEKLKNWSKEYFQFVNTRSAVKTFPSADNINYVIWKNPWMCVSKNTFIGSVMRYLNVHLPEHEKKYFEISEADLQKSYCLFSSEPYPFQKGMLALIQKGFRGELIDGESISWFGYRNLNFLKNLK